MADAKRRERILIGIPCYSGVTPEVLEDYMRFAFHCGRRLPQYDFFIGIRSKAEQFRARNSIVEGAQEVGADWLLMLDDDMIVNPYVTQGTTPDYGFIEKLIAHDKDIIGALYYQRTGGCLPVAMKKVGERGYRFLRDDEITHGLQRVDVVGGGAMLVRMKVFDRLPHPYFAPEHEFGTDIQLCRAAAAKGMEVWLDSSIELGHVRNERVIITSRNKAGFAMESEVPGEAKRMVTTDVYTSLFNDAMEYTGYGSIEEMGRVGNKFMTVENRKKHSSISGWYSQYPMERVARQVWFNTANEHKRRMTETILATVGDQIKANILDFGCGIGITAFELAKRGHRVTACDLQGTGTIEFLRWRAKKHGVDMTFNYTGSEDGVPALGGAKFGAVIAMDCLEHIPRWRRVLYELSIRLEEGGLLFCNNGILDDREHPEHVDLLPRDFVNECISLNLAPYSQIAFLKRVPVDVAEQEGDSHAEGPNSRPRGAGRTFA